MRITIRWIPFVAWHFCISSVVLLLITLLAGINGGSLGDSAPIITFNTSSLGLAQYNSPNATLHLSITALVPNPPPTNLLSITQYLGIKDWYSMHYLSVCSGYFDPSTTNPINLSCTRHASGYTFSLQDTLRQELYPSVKALSEDITERSYDTAPWISLWHIGLVCAILEAGLLPWTWAGTRRLNGWRLLLSFISYITFQISSSFTTTHTLNAHHNAFNITDPTISSLIPSPSPYASAFLGLTWSTTACMIVVFVLEHFEWRFELWTLKGDRITIYRKPLLKSWSLVDAVAFRKPVKVDSIAVEEGIELR